MAQNVRGQTLIDAIVEVFQEPPGGHALTPDDVARRVRERGFWGGKEPKASEQMVESYLRTRHAGMFEPGPGGTFSLKSVYGRPSTTASPAAPAVARTAATVSVAGRPVAPHAGTVARPATVAMPGPATPSGVPAASRRKRARKRFGGATIAHLRTHGAPADSLPERFALQLSFVEAMKLHLSLGELLGTLNRRQGCEGSGSAAAELRVNFSKGRITVRRGRTPSKSAARHQGGPSAMNDWGVEAG